MRRLHVVLLLAAAVALAGCRVDARVRVTMDDNGRGVVETTVTFDAEAVGRVETNGQTLETAFPLDDFAEAGWTVGAWERNDDGSAEIVLSRGFTGAEQLNQRLAELVGATDVLHDARIIRERGLFRTRDEVSVEADTRGLSAGVQADPELAASLTAAGLDVATLDQQLTAELRDAFRLQVTLEGPGGKTDSVDLAPGEAASVAAAESEFNSDRLALLIMAGSLVFLAVLLYLSASISARRGRAREVRAEPDRTPLM